MGKGAGRTPVLVRVLGTLSVLVLGLVWGLTPEDLRGVYLLLAGAAMAVIYVGIYVVERRRHW